MNNRGTGPRLSAYIAMLREGFDGGGWYGEGSIEKLNGLDEETAFRQPAPGKHSVAELVAHATYWRTVLIKFIEGDREYRERTVDTTDFRQAGELRKAGWKNIYESFRDSQQTLLSVLESKDDSFLDTIYADNHPYDRIVRGVVEHDLYHLGQIGYVLGLVR